MSDVSRRTAIGTVALGVAAAASPAVTSAQAAAAANPSAPAFAGGHQPKPLGFDPMKLDGLSEKLIRSHWENN